MEREELIQICKDAVVPFIKWKDRDSYRAQHTISDIHGLLSVNTEYDITDSDEDTIQIMFKNLTPEQEKQYDKHLLPIDSREDYFKQFGYEGEMFNGGGVGKEYLGGYMPTRKKLDEVSGDDWY